MRNKFYILVLLFLQIGCTYKTREYKNEFSINLSLGLETIDVVASNSPQSIWVLILTNEGLVSYNKENKIVPQIARQWKISNDGIFYTFTLNTNIEFHDDACFPGGKGRKVIASDVKYCFERLNNPSAKTRGLWLLRDKVKGVQEFIDAKTKNETADISGIRVINDSTLQIELIKPFAPFLSLLTMSYAYIYPHEAVEYYGNDINYHCVGTGPFKFSKWEIDKELILERNEKYYEKDSANNSLPYLNKIVFSFSQSKETEFLDFLNGKYDYHEPNAEVLDALTDDNGKLEKPDERAYYLVRQPWLNTVYLIMNQNSTLSGGQNSPFRDNKKLRQALNYALDREKIVKYILRNRGTAAKNGPLPSGMPGFDSSISGYTFDREKAVKLLAEARYPNGKGLDLKLVISNDELQRSLAIAIQDQYKDIGIKMEIEQILQATLNTKQQDGELAFTRGNWGADYFDPENFMALFYSKNIVPFGPNKTGYANPEVDKLYEKSIRITDFEERKKIYNEMERIVLDDAAWVFLYYNQRVYLLQKNVNGFYLDGLNNLVVKYVRKG